MTERAKNDCSCTYLILAVQLKNILGVGVYHVTGNLVLTQSLNNIASNLLASYKATGVQPLVTVARFSRK